MYAMQRTLRLADGPDEVHRAAIGKYEIGKHVPKEMMRSERR
jgi:acyl-CoA dehydrogenase